MKTITIRLNAEEEKAFREYAKVKNIPLPELFKMSLEEKIKDEIDLRSIEKYEERRKAGKTEYIDFDDLKRELDI